MFTDTLEVNTIQSFCSLGMYQPERLTSLQNYSASTAALSPPIPRKRWYHTNPIQQFQIKFEPFRFGDDHLPELHKSISLVGINTLVQLCGKTSARCDSVQFIKEKT